MKFYSAICEDCIAAKQSSQIAQCQQPLRIGAVPGICISSQRSIRRRRLGTLQNGGPDSRNHIHHGPWIKKLTDSNVVRLEIDEERK